MILSFHTNGVELTERFKKFATEKIELALDQFESQVKRIRIFLADINGPNRGGEDKSCRIVVNMYRQQALIVEDRDANLAVVVDRAADRIGIAACRRAERLQSRRQRAIHGRSYTE